MNQKKVLFSFLTLLLNFISGSINDRIPSFVCNNIDSECNNRYLSLERNSCDIQVDYDKEESKLSGKCKFYVNNTSKWLRYKFKVHVCFEDNNNETIFSESSYPNDIKPSTGKDVTFMVPRQAWDGSRMITHISPRIEILWDNTPTPREISYLLFLGTFLLYCSYRYAYLRKFSNFIYPYSYPAKFLNFVYYSYSYLREILSGSTALALPK